MYSLPQEIEVWYIIPAIRKELSRIFSKKYGLSFEQAGKILGISKAAVSQYLSRKRANKFKLPEEVKKEIEKSATLIIKDNKRAVSEIEKILRSIRERKCSCSVCRKYNPEILNLCRSRCQK
jgi:predicted transcriptional regulator